MVDNNKGFHFSINLIMILLSACCLLPFILLVMSSLTEESALVRDGYAFWPKAFSLDAYAYIFSGSAKIIRGYGITLLVPAVNNDRHTYNDSFGLPSVAQGGSGKRRDFLFCVFYNVV